MKRNSTHSGRYGESMARGYLVEHGYRIIAQNFRFGRHGEIDFIAYDGDTLAFIEVKYRRSSTYGSPEDAIGHRKRLQLRKIAEAFLSIHPENATNYRFDVVAIEASSSGLIFRLWKNAFW